MKITNLTLSSNKREVADLSFRDPTSANPFIAKKVDGLDLDQISAKFYGFSANGGDPFYQIVSRRGDITITIILNPKFSENQTYSSLRDELYKAIASSRKGRIELQFKEGLSTRASILGTVTKFEAPLFDVEAKVVLTIKPVRNSTLRAPNLVEIDTSGLFAENTIIDSWSTAPHGVSMAVRFTSSASSITFSDGETEATSSSIFRVDYPFLTGDILTVDNSEITKVITVTREAVVTSIADKIIAGSHWPIMFPSSNDVNVTSLGATEVVWEHFKFYPTYWGI